MDCKVFQMMTDMIIRCKPRNKCYEIPHRLVVRGKEGGGGGGVTGKLFATVHNYLKMRFCLTF